jgi:hypothetical protein
MFHRWNLSQIIPIVNNVEFEIRADRQDLTCSTNGSFGFDTSQEETCLRC